MIIYRNIFALLTCKGNFRFVRLTSIHYRNLLLQVNIFLRLYYVQKKESRAKTWLSLISGTRCLP